MGMFSWLTDTNESIANVHSNREVKPVFLLQPNGVPPIAETSYSGYGRFADVDAYEWLAMQNVGIKDRSLGVFIECGSYYENGDTCYACSMHTDTKNLRALVEDKNKKIVLFDNYNSQILDGLTVNQAIEKGLLVSKVVPCKFPLKFSFNPNTVYEDVDASASCPDQGFFYAD